MDEEKQQAFLDLLSNEINSRKQVSEGPEECSWALESRTIRKQIAKIESSDMNSTKSPRCLYIIKLDVTL